MIHFPKNIIFSNKHNGPIFMYFIYSSFHPPKKKNFSLLPNKTIQTSHQSHDSQDKEKHFFWKKKFANE